MAKQELCVVTAREEYGSGLFALTLHAPGLAALAQPVSLSISPAAKAVFSAVQSRSAMCRARNLKSFSK